VSVSARPWPRQRFRTDRDDCRVEIGYAGSGYRDIVIYLPERCPMCGSGHRDERRATAVSAARR
jgi:hypothetical protein